MTYKRQQYNWCLVQSQFESQKSFMVFKVIDISCLVDNGDNCGFTVFAKRHVREKSIEHRWKWRHEHFGVQGKFWRSALSRDCCRSYFHRKIHSAHFHFFHVIPSTNTTMTQYCVLRSWVFTSRLKVTYDKINTGQIIVCLCVFPRIHERWSPIQEDHGPSCGGVLSWILFWNISLETNTGCMQTIRN